jgi:hypothetical protein
MGQRRTIIALMLVALMLVALMLPIVLADVQQEPAGLIIQPPGFWQNLLSAFSGGTFSAISQTSQPSGWTCTSTVTASKEFNTQSYTNFNIGSSCQDNAQVYLFMCRNNNCNDRVKDGMAYKIAGSLPVFSNLAPNTMYHYDCYQCNVPAVIPPPVTPPVATQEWSCIASSPGYCVVHQGASSCYTYQDSSGRTVEYYYSVQVACDQQVLALKSGAPRYNKKDNCVGGSVCCNLASNGAYASLNDCINAVAQTNPTKCINPNAANGQLTCQLGYIYQCATASDGTQKWLRQTTACQYGCKSETAIYNTVSDACNIPPNSCTQTTSATDYSKKGTVSFVRAGYTGTATDFCSGSNILVKQYCSSNEALSKQVNCNCANGVCAQVTPPVTDLCADVHCSDCEICSPQSGKCLTDPEKCNNNNNNNNDDTKIKTCTGNVMCADGITVKQLCSDGQWGLEQDCISVKWCATPLGDGACSCSQKAACDASDTALSSGQECSNFCKINTTNSSLCPTKDFGFAKVKGQCQDFSGCNSPPEGAKLYSAEGDCKATINWWDTFLAWLLSLFK